MHMSDALLSPAVGVAMCAVSAGAVAWAAGKVRADELCERKIPVMGVMGAFVFAAQMVNFTIPATGSSGHICGGVLLAAMIGALPALLSISAVLIVQCLFFADGGLLALGCNVFNLGVIPCLAVYPLVFRPIARGGMTPRRIVAASVAASVAALQLGALGVVAETRLSGIAELPFSTFALLMLPVHLAIGLAEGAVTAAALCFVHKMRPEIMESAADRAAIPGGAPVWNVVAALTAITLLAGGGLSLFASSYPDGLDWAVEKTAGTAELGPRGAIAEKAAEIRSAAAVMPDYGFKNADGGAAGTAAAGIAGGAMTFLLAGGAALAISVVRKRRNNEKQRP